MGVPGLTLRQIKSHLQKLRLDNKKPGLLENLAGCDADRRAAGGTNAVDEQDSRSRRQHQHLSPSSLRSAVTGVELPEGSDPAPIAKANSVVAPSESDCRSLQLALLRQMELQNMLYQQLEVRVSPMHTCVCARHLLLLCVQGHAAVSKASSAALLPAGPCVITPTVMPT